MKTSRKSFFTLSIFRRNRKFTSFLATLLTIACLNLFVGCKYYNVKDIASSPESISNKVEEFNQEQKYAIIHSGDQIWHLEDITINKDQQHISGTSQAIDSSHIPLKPRDSKKYHRYTIHQKPLNEVHFYLKDRIVPSYGTDLTLSFSEIAKVSVNERDTGRTIANAFLGTIGVMAAVLIIVALTKSSCPFIYVHNGEEFVFTGELYPGVLTSNQQRDDYIKLPHRTVESEYYSIKITNELKEIQYTDLAQLVQINHAEGVEVLLDSKGNPLTFSHLLNPISSEVQGKQSSLNSILEKDDDYHLFNTVDSESSSISSINLKFTNPENLKQAKLYLTAKNSMWLDYIFGKFNEQFGSYYPEFQKKQQEYSRERNEKWIREQHIPLSVYLKTDNGWRLVERINTIGPMANRDLAIPIDLTGTEGDEIEIKLETGFMFWELDYAAIDYSINEQVQITYINPSEAIDSNGNLNALQLLTEADYEFLIQPNVGDQVLVNYKLLQNENGEKSTYYLKNRGYYNYIRNYEGTPNLQKLSLFKEAAAFTDFSRYEYEAFMDYDSHVNSNQSIK